MLCFCLSCLDCEEVAVNKKLFSFNQGKNQENVIDLKDLQGFGKCIFAHTIIYER